MLKVESILDPGCECVAICTILMHTVTYSWPCGYQLLQWTGHEAPKAETLVHEERRVSESKGGLTISEIVVQVQGPAGRYYDSNYQTLAKRYFIHAYFRPMHCSKCMSGARHRGMWLVCQVMLSYCYNGCL